MNDAEHIEGLQEVIDKALSGESTGTIVLLCSFPPRVDNELIEALKLSGLYFKVYAPSFYEAANHFGLPNEEQLLEERLIYGNYPEVLDDLAKLQSLGEFFAFVEINESEESFILLTGPELLVVEWPSVALVEICFDALLTP